MNINASSRFSKLAATLAVLTALVVAMPSGLQAAGGSKSGGGSTKVVESVVTGYVTAINYATGAITIGASYYGSGALHVTSATKLSFVPTGSRFSDIKVGDWAEARYIWTTKQATKLSITVVTPP